MKADLLIIVVILLLGILTAVRLELYPNAYTDAKETEKVLELKAFYEQAAKDNPAE